jgi:hypothetical protein
MHAAQGGSKNLLDAALHWWHALQPRRYIKAPTPCNACTLHTPTPSVVHMHNARFPSRRSVRCFARSDCLLRVRALNYVPPKPALSSTCVVHATPSNHDTDRGRGERRDGVGFISIRIASPRRQVSARGSGPSTGSLLLAPVTIFLC